MMKLSNYDEIDFAKLYKEQKQITTFKPKSKEDWDKKAPKMNENIHKSNYIEQFISRMEFDENTSVLDMGCGPGTIGLKLAPMVKDVLEADYSIGMLKCVEDNVKKLDLKNVKVKQLSFEDSWEDIPQKDIVIASRCLEVEDIKDALTKLISKAKKRVYITYNVGKSFLGDEISNLISDDIYPKPDYIYVLNVIYQLGFKAKVDFLSHKDCKFIANDFDEFLQAVEWSYGKKLTIEDKERLQEYYKVHKALYREMTWAFIEIIKED